MESRTLADVVSAFPVSSFGDWNDPTIWNTNPYSPNNGNPPGKTYDVSIDNDALIRLQQSVSIDRLALASGTLNVGSSVFQIGSFQSGGGLLQLYGATLRTPVIPASASVAITRGTLNSHRAGGVIFDGVAVRGAVTVSGGWSLNMTGASRLDGGTITVQSGMAELTGGSVVSGELDERGTIQLFDSPYASEAGYSSVNATIGQGITLRAAGGYSTIAGSGAYTNIGNIVAEDGNALYCGDGLIGTALTNSGAITARTGGSILVKNLTNLTYSPADGGETLSGGTYEVSGGSVLWSIPGPPPVTVNDASVKLDAPSSVWGFNWSIRQNKGTFAITGGRDFSITNAISNTGTLWAGVGSDLDITGALTQAATGTLKIEIAGNDAESFGQFNITGGATLDGTFDVELANGFVPRLGDVFPILSANAITGSFATLDLPPRPAGESWLVNSTSQQVSLRVVPEPSTCLVAAIFPVARFVRSKDRSCVPPSRYCDDGSEAVHTHTRF